MVYALTAPVETNQPRKVTKTKTRTRTTDYNRDVDLDEHVFFRLRLQPADHKVTPEGAAGRFMTVGILL